MNDFKEIFDPNLPTDKLSLLYFTYCDDVRDKEKEEFESTYSKAYSIALEREFKDAQNGIYR